MKEGVKIAAVVVLSCLFAGDLGYHAANDLAPASQGIVSHQSTRNAEKPAGGQPEASSTAPTRQQGIPSPTEAQHTSYNRESPDIWVIVQGVSGAAVAAFTFFLMKIADRQASISREQSRLAQRQMVIANRPRLRVRNIVIETPFAGGQTIRGQFYISNIGGTPARVVESHAEFLWNV